MPVLLGRPQNGFNENGKNRYFSNILFLRKKEVQKMEKSSVTVHGNPCRAWRKWAEWLN
jgi:hypothetical protein